MPAALDNTFVQLRGAKDVLLFARDAGGMRAFPHDHPFSSRSQVDLEKPDAQAREELRGRGALARLEAGDALFIPAYCTRRRRGARRTREQPPGVHMPMLGPACCEPPAGTHMPICLDPRAADAVPSPASRLSARQATSRAREPPSVQASDLACTPSDLRCGCTGWHHIQSRADNDVSISLNFWMDPSRLLHEQMQRDGRLPSPPTDLLHANLLSEIERLLTPCAPKMPERAALFASLRERLGYASEDDSDGATAAAAPPIAPPDAKLPQEALAKRNFVLQMLVSSLGDEGARRFCDSFCHPSRWSDLKPVYFLERPN